MKFVERYRAIVDLPRPVLHQVRVADFLNEIDQLVGSDLRRRGISFVCTAPFNRVASFDPALVEQAILNLIKNAADAVEQTADPVVRLVGLRDADALLIEVHDNGVGIEDDLLEEIFVPFFTTKPDGAGIGLALARQVALAHGGGLTARRANPANTVFELRLPVQS